MDHLENSNSPDCAPDDVNSAQLYIVGIGASAGGLEALQELFKSMPTNTGAGFVVIQHLSPDYKSLMDELLSRCTAMPVAVAAEDQSVERDHIYLIPPGKHLTLFHSRLYLKMPQPNRGSNLAVDTFLESLAADAGGRSIAVILSGAGSDGALGIRAVKEAGGMVMVQDAATAKFDSMPQNALATGLPDFVLPPAEMGRALAHYLRHPNQAASALSPNEAKSGGDAFTKLLEVLRDYTGIDFFAYKESTLIRRLERRVSINRFFSLNDYLPYFIDSDQEKALLFRELLIGVTGFFRDPEAFEAVASQILPQLKPVNRLVRIWSAACSTGEEVYSLAMLLAEHIRKNKLDWDVKIFATDIDRKALATAAQGFYPDSQVADVPPHFLSQYFVRQEGGYQINNEIRRMLVFSFHNVLRDPPFSKLDMLVCRNLFIYLKPQVQQDLLSVFYNALNPGGILFLGSSESVGEMGDAFEPVNSRCKLFCRLEGAHPAFSGLLRVSARLPAALPADRSAGRDGNRMEHILEAAFSAALPPCVVVDACDNIIHTNRIGDVLVYPTGKFTSNLFANLPDDVALFVSGILRRLRGGDSETLSVCAKGLAGLGGDEILITGYAFAVRQTQYYLLTFQRKAGTACASEGFDGNGEMHQRIRELEQELGFTREGLQAAVEGLETSNEELQSSNEELEASNEELQSTNEELQSVNEELYTVNSEYQNKINELMRLNNDLDNLLKNTEIGALYLDGKLCIRKITPIISEITHIMEMDVGRPLSHLSLMEGYPECYDDIRAVQETLQPVDREIHDAKGRAWLARIRPYRTEYNSVDGVIVTFVEITTLHHMEELALSRVQELMDPAAPPPGTVELLFNRRNCLLRAGKGAAELFSLPVEALCGKNWSTLVTCLETREGKPLSRGQEPLEILKAHGAMDTQTYRLTTPQSVVPIRISGRALISPAGEYEGAALLFMPAAKE